MIKLFNERTIQDAFLVVEGNIHKDIEKMNESLFATSTIDDLASRMSANRTISPLSIDFAGRKATVDMVDIPGSRFPGQYDVDPNKYYSRARVSYSLGISGNVELLSVRPQSRTFVHNLDANIQNGLLILSYQTLYGDRNLSETVQNEVKDAMSTIFDEIPRMLEAINNEIAAFNNSIHDYILSELNNKKESLDKQSKLNQNLNDF